MSLSQHPAFNYNYDHIAYVSQEVPSFVASLISLERQAVLILLDRKVYKQLEL
jgi:hypothetical protein